MWTPIIGMTSIVISGAFFTALMKSKNRQEFIAYFLWGLFYFGGMMLFCGIILLLDKLAS